MRARMHSGNASAVQEAHDAFRRGDYSAVIGVLEPHLIPNPDDVSAWALLGAAYFRCGHWEHAARAAHQSVALRPSNAQYWCNLGRALRNGGRTQEACSAFERCLDLEPGNELAASQLAEIGQASNGARTTPDERRCPACGAPVAPGDQRCLGCDYNLATGVPRSAETNQRRIDFHNWAFERAERDGHLREAEQHLVSLVHAQPDVWQTWARLARFQQRIGAPDRALETWEGIARTHSIPEVVQPYVDCVLQVSELRSNRHDFDGAADLCARAQRIAGDQPALRARLEAIHSARETYHNEERDASQARSQRAHTATVGGGFGLLGGALTMVAGVLLMMLGLAMVPCCIGIFILPVAFTVFMSGMAMMAGAPLGGAAVWSVGELPRALRRSSEYWSGLTPEARKRATVGVVIAIGAMVVLALIGLTVGSLASRADW